MPRRKEISTIEQEFEYMNKTWTKLEMYEKVTIITYTFLFLYLIIVSLASYDGLTKSHNPDAGKAVFWLMLITAVITLIPVIAHYTGISTYGIIHIIGIVGIFTFVAGLWILFEVFDKRVIEQEEYKDPYSMAVYFLLVSFTVMFILASISRKL